MIYLGTLINFFSIILGSIIGLLFKRALPKKLEEILFQGCGLITFIIGVDMALKSKNFLIVVISIIIGGIIGELINLEINLDKGINKLKSILVKNKENSNNFSEGFITSSMIFCVGSMAILGSLDSGLRNNHTILITKSVLDGFMSIILASTLGISVIFSCIPVLIYQGLIVTLASVTQIYFSTDYVLPNLTSTGGVLIVGLGFVLLNVKKIKVLNLTPSLIVVFLISNLFKNL